MRLLRFCTFSLLSGIFWKFFPAEGFNILPIDFILKCHHGFCVAASHFYKRLLWPFSKIYLMLKFFVKYDISYISTNNLQVTDLICSMYCACSNGRRFPRRKGKWAESQEVIQPPIREIWLQMAGKCRIWEFILGYLPPSILQCGLWSLPSYHCTSVGRPDTMGQGKVAGALWHLALSFPPLCLQHSTTVFLPLQHPPWPLIPGAHWLGRGRGDGPATLFGVALPWQTAWIQMLARGREAQEPIVLYWQWVDTSKDAMRVACGQTSRPTGKTASPHRELS